MKILTKSKFLLFGAALALATGCGVEDISETPKGNFFEENYYKNEEQCFSGLVSVYDVLRKNSGGFENMITMMNAGSDDFYAGGGSPSDGAGIHGFDNFTINELNVPRSFFGDYYRGITRANVLIAKLPDATFSSETQKARFLAEARTLRAFYYFELVNLFGNIPLITAPISATEAYQIPQASKADVYAFIESELVAAVGDLPTTVSNSELGRLTQGAGKAILGKVYLFEEKWAEAAAQLQDVNGTPGGTSMYGYKLVADFASLWSINNKFNTESILEVQHTNLSNAGWGNWGSSSDEGNTVNQMVGPRGFSRSDMSIPSYISGWSFNTVTQSLYDAMSGDPRFSATIFDLKTLKAQNRADYAAADQDTGYFLKKFMPLTTETSTGGGNAELNYRQNTYWIRLADTYLMEAEALVHTGNVDRARDLVNAVRNRVGLAPLPAAQVTLSAIYNERRLELAGEGHRFFDLVRTQNTAPLVPFGFQSGKNEVLPLPFEDIANTKLVQNPGYN